MEVLLLTSVLWMSAIFNTREITVDHPYFSSLAQPRHAPGLGQKERRSFASDDLVRVAMHFNAGCCKNFGGMVLSDSQDHTVTSYKLRMDGKATRPFSPTSEYCRCCKCMSWTPQVAAAWRLPVGFVVDTVTTFRSARRQPASYF
ncbi:hypothetical protein B0T25DRAFT_107589 [Lasiosphaeria hispida]|uniref:CENP-V/GFA domain-containing protein n=1 Tax=Lasiosphaeria hispida TaxID=260671 RepID=A0AAJ0HQQ5_9PEZI|nr:hypothetical protein B0T25DRAFT_107589 [Lasiosphaeria hispida]